MRQALSVRLNNHCRQLQPPARDAKLHQPAGRDAGRVAGPYSKKGCRRPQGGKISQPNKHLPACQFPTFCRQIGYFKVYFWIAHS